MASPPSYPRGTMGGRGPGSLVTLRTISSSEQSEQGQDSWWNAGRRMLRMLQVRFDSQELQYQAHLECGTKSWSLAMSVEC